MRFRKALSSLRDDLESMVGRLRDVDELIAKKIYAIDEKEAAAERKRRKDNPTDLERANDHIRELKAELEVTRELARDAGIIRRRADQLRNHRQLGHPPETAHLAKDDLESLGMMASRRNGE